MKGRYSYKAICVSVLSGDTLTVMIDLGFKVWINSTIRLFGINSPSLLTKNLDERKKAMQSKNRLEELLKDKEFLLKSMDVNKNGRCLAEVIVDNKNINELMVNEGHATVFLTK